MPRKRGCVEFERSPRDRSRRERDRHPQYDTVVDKHLKSIVTTAFATEKPR